MSFVARGIQPTKLFLVGREKQRIVFLVYPVCHFCFIALVL